MNLRLTFSVVLSITIFGPVELPSNINTDILQNQLLNYFDKLPLELTQIHTSQALLEIT